MNFSGGKSPDLSFQRKNPIDTFNLAKCVGDFLNRFKNFRKIVTILFCLRPSWCAVGFVVINLRVTLNDLACCPVGLKVNRAPVSCNLSIICRVGQTPRSQENSVCWWSFSSVFAFAKRTQARVLLKRYTSRDSLDERTERVLIKLMDKYGGADVLRSSSCFGTVRDEIYVFMVLRVRSNLMAGCTYLRVDVKMFM